MKLEPLAGFTVAVTADRRADEQAALLSRLGATVVHGPVIRTESVTDRIYKNLSERARENLREEIDFLRGLRPTDIRDARKKVVSVVRQLEEAGTITIERVGVDDGV